MYLGLDPSMRSFGWSIVDLDAVGAGRIVERGTFRTGARDFFLDRYTYLQQQLIDLVSTHKGVVDMVGCESPVFGEQYSEGLYGLYLFTMVALRRSGVDVVLFTPPQLKALARGCLGGRKMFKVDVQDWAKSLVTVPGSAVRAKLRINSHEADASVAAWYAGRFARFVTGALSAADLNSVEAHVFLREHRITRGMRAGLLEKKGLVYRENDRFFLFSRAHLESPEVLDG
jgi:Holliday junction resolvasome RuvABC endonuclease subunit